MFSSVVNHIAFATRISNTGQKEEKMQLEEK
jgi:hypothetical protein